jgi:hypothetical protein
MYRILSASKDTYITDKIVGNSFRATDANVGQAGTLDLFKLYDESKISGSSAPIELSRILIKFELEPLRALTSSILDLNSSNFKCVMQLSDCYGGQTTPTNFKLVVHPLSKSFDEGFGRDIVSFQDLDSTNFLTASSREGIVAWSGEGASNEGLLGSPDIDIITSGVLDVGITSLASEQVFTTGEEDLNVDVTTVVSATLAGIIPDHGFRIAFTSSQETDERTRFVKRFGSRHSTNTRFRPRLKITFDDSIQDDHENFFFDLSGSLFLNNFHRGQPSNILSGSGLTPITGPDSLLLTLTSGSYSASFTGSQHTIGGNQIAGIYSASFAINSQEPLLRTEILNAGSATFSEVWSSLDGTVPYLSSTLVIKSINRTGFSNEQNRLIVNVTNSRSVYRVTERARFRVHALDAAIGDGFKLSKLPLERKSVIFRNMYYRVRDANSGDIIIPFDTSTDSTKMSTDNKGMYFELFMDSFDIGRVYEFDILLRDRGVDQLFKNVGGRFRVEP